MAAFFSLVVILLLLCGGSLEEDHGICTLHGSGTNQVMYFLETLFHGQQHQIMAYCTSFNNELQGPDCNIHRGFMVSVVSTGGGPIMNMDYAVLEEKHEPEHEINMPKLGFPISYWNFGSQDTYDTTYISFHIFRSKVKMEPSVPNCGHYHHGCRLRDDAKLCAPSGTCLLQPDDKLSLDYLDMALYVNEYHATSGYFFIKKGSNVGVYPITFEALLHGRDQYANRRTPKLEFASVEQFHVIENFPTQNYQDHFFAFDPHYGCFALLFWEGSRSKAPEVHYYLFDESRPSDNVQFVDKIVLHDFDFYDIFDASKGYHDNIMNFPVFKSFGRQVFIGLPDLRAPQIGQQQQQQQSYPDSKVHRYRIWTPNPYESRYSDNVRIHHDVHSAARRTFFIDGRFIRTDQAKLPEPSTAKATTTTRKTTAAPTTTTTTTVATTSTTTTLASTTTTAAIETAPSTTKMATTTPSTAPSTTATSTSTSSASTTTDVGASTAPETSTSTTSTEFPSQPEGGVEDYGDEAHGNHGQNGETSDASGFWCGSIYNSWWGLTLFIIICSILGIFIVFMIVVVLIGRRKEQIYGKKKEKKDKKKDGATKKAGEKQDSASGKVVGEVDGDKPNGEALGKNAATTTPGKKDGSKKDRKKKEGGSRGSSKKEKKNASSTKEKKLDAKKDEQPKARSSKKVKKNLSAKERKNKK